MSLSALMERRDSIKAGLEGTGAIAQGEKAWAVGERGMMARDVQGLMLSGDGNIVIVATDHFLRQYFPKQISEKDLRQATETYLAHLIQTYRYLDFKGMGVSHWIPLQLPLTEMYVPLKARIQMPGGETWSRNLRVAGRNMFEDEVEDESRRLSEPTSILKLLQDHDGLILLGDPGSGKTTFLKYLALKLSQAQGNELGLLPDCRFSCPCLPMPMPWRTRIFRSVDSLHSTTTTGGLELPIEGMLEKTLVRGGALLLLDGLDEVRDLRYRCIVVNRVVDFFNFHRQRGNKFVITSRIVGYREVRPAIKGGLVECTLADFEDEEITSFVEKWDNRTGKSGSG